jgi:hypothetical protein
LMMVASRSKVSEIDIYVVCNSIGGHDHHCGTSESMVYIKDPLQLETK